MVIIISYRAARPSIINQQNDLSVQQMLPLRMGEENMTIERNTFKTAILSKN